MDTPEVPPKRPLTQAVGSQVKRVVRLYHPKTWREKGALWASGLMAVTYVVLNIVLILWWSNEPPMFDITQNALEKAGGDNAKVVTGLTTTATLIHVAETLLNKPGGYLSNDIAPPGRLMDNMPNWEYGVLTQIRDLARLLRNDFSRSQSQSSEDPDLREADPKFSSTNDRWLFPSSESEYQKGVDYLTNYLNRLYRSDAPDSQFYARADNLRDWLAIIEKRLGNLSQRLSASVGQTRVNTDLAGDANATQSTIRPSEVLVKTPWLEIDDVFYEARGMTWALTHFLRAVETDFAETLGKKNALPSLRQIIRELESTRSTVWSPMVLNGGGFGVVTNYSLVMANYISRANAAVIDLRNLLSQG